ncbi:MAG TPA: hypothetical protein VMW78_09790 [Anaerolineae bacterium]|nr:hypothetical protein [Anaerolineae bacterium]
MNNENSLNQDVEKAQALEEENIIELTDEVVEVSEKGVEPGEFPDIDAQLSTEDIIEFYEIEDKKEDEPIAKPADDNYPASDMEIDNIFEEKISDDNMPDKFADSLGMDLESEIDALEEDIHEEVPLSFARLEETLERIVEKMFSEKIEKMLAEMIESAVSREIKSIKEKLQDL